MKSADLHCGEQYAIAEGHQSQENIFNAHRAIVLDPAPRGYENIPNYGLSDIWNSAQDKQRQVRPRISSRKRARILCAVELKIHERFLHNPETGEPWKDDYDRRQGKTLVVGTVWVPYAALAQEIRCPWAQEQRRIEERSAMAEISRLQLEKQRVRDAERREREAQEGRKRHEQMEKERALRTEMYDTRVAPLLAEAGLDLDNEVKYDSGRTRVEISMEALARLLERAKNESSP